MIRLQSASILSNIWFNQFNTLSLTTGVKPGEKIAIYAETRQEWTIAALGAFSQNITGIE